MSTDRVGDSREERLALAFSQHVVCLQTLFEQAIAPALSAQGLTTAELDVLAALRSVGVPYQLRPKELAARLLLTTGGLSNVLRRLEARGLVSRIPDPSDGRSHNVRLTLTGVTTAQLTTAAATTALQQVLTAVPAATLEDTLIQLRAILATVADSQVGTLAFRYLPEPGGPDCPTVG
ncbi:MarR family winged helix-turn-helix transcriptional regulator [Streptomyces sp. NPDC094144]|uniref:MarR family winged helix-turn-helix transcriptional regulator n=1 Tax=Streptomyces sp. NPDC094144 TaxID=3366056 RepID=UPI003823E5EC